MEKIFVSSEQLEKFQWNFHERCDPPPHTHTSHLFKLFHFVKCQLVQAHSDKGSFNLRAIVDLYLLKVMENRK